MLERHETDVLLSLAEELHFGRTAERLRLTTGQVSKTLKKLERRIGTPLFERTSRVVRLTAIGRQLVEDLTPLVAGMDDAVARAIDAGRGVSGTLYAGYVGAQAEQLLLNTVRLFSARHPDCEVIIQRETDSRARLLRGDVDIVFAAFPYGGMACGPVLSSEPRVLAVPVGHPLEGRESVSLEVLGDHPVIQLPSGDSKGFRDERTPEFAPSGRPTLKGPIGYSFDEMLSHVAIGKGVYPVGGDTPRHYPRPDLAYVPIHDAAPVERGTVWLETNTTARVRAFVQAASDANRKTGEPSGRA